MIYHTTSPILGSNFYFGEDMEPAGNRRERRRATKKRTTFQTWKQKNKI